MDSFSLVVTEVSRAKKATTTVVQINLVFATQAALVYDKLGKEEVVAMIFTEKFVLIP